MTIKTTLVALTLIVLLAACGGTDAPQTDSTATDAEAAGDTRLTDAVNEPLDKAKAVEDMAKQRKAEMDAKLEEIEGDAKTDDVP